MRRVRWYDKNPGLKEVFEFIENLDEPVQKKIANDIIQILLEDFGLDLDEKINNISKNYTYECKRWYDNNIDLFTSFDIIKTLHKELQNEIVKKIVESILLVYLEDKETELEE